MMRSPASTIRCRSLFKTGRSSPKCGASTAAWANSNTICRPRSRTRKPSNNQMPPDCVVKYSAIDMVGPPGAAAGMWHMLHIPAAAPGGPTISMAEYFTTQSGGIWLLLCFLVRLRGLQMVFEFAQAAVDAPHFGDDLPVLNKLRNRIVDAGERIIDLHHHAEGEQADKQAGTEHQKRHHPHVDQIEVLPHIEQRIVPV